MSCNGFCCRGESGYIFVSYDEIQKLAAYLGHNTTDFMQKFIRKVGYRFSLVEKPIYSALGMEYACCFFDEEKQRCLVYQIRPKQCQTFPFWERFAHLPFKEIQKECPFVKPL